MAEAEPRPEGAGEPRAGPGGLPGAVPRLVLPHVEDSRGDGQRRGPLEERPNLREGGTSAEPEGAEPEVLDLLDRVEAVLMPPPDADRADLHGWSVPCRRRRPHVGPASAV